MKTNGTITRKVVCFEKRDNEYLVFIMVYGYDVDLEDFRGVTFQDKLPLYSIHAYPESKLQEHMELFNNPSYKGGFFTPEDEKCPPKIDPEQHRNGGMLPEMNRQHALVETTSSAAGKIDDL